MINKELENVINKYKIEKTQNIIYGTNIPMPKAVVPTPWATYIRFDKAEYYFFYFDENGIRLYLKNGESFVDILWTEVLDFKIKHFLLLGKMIIKTKDDTYKFQINRFVIGCPWIGKNTKYLESKNYFYKKKEQ